MQSLKVMFFACLILIVSGCKTTIPMPSYLNQPITNYGNSELTQQQVEKSIIQAAISKGWKSVKVEEGKIRATLNIRKHRLDILITYDNKLVSIEYIDSANLKYNGKEIHRQYANWVSSLLNTINALVVVNND